MLRDEAMFNSALCGGTNQDTERFELLMIGLLYESDEWSDYKLAKELEAQGCSVDRINLAQDEDAIERAMICDMLVSRIFASAVFRGHEVAHERMARLASAAEQSGITMVNPARAHFFEIDKRASTTALSEAGIDTPRIQACGYPTELNPQTLSYPVIIKPNCGGRTTATAIARTSTEAQTFLSHAPNLVYLVEDYLEPTRGYITRIEIVGGTCALIVKRGIAAGGLSAYHLGSTYELYPTCSAATRAMAEHAAKTLSYIVGSFDIIERSDPRTGEARAYVIDANSVSNVSEDNTEMFQFDLMHAHAACIARMWHEGERRNYAVN